MWFGSLVVADLNDRRLQLLRAGLQKPYDLTLRYAETSLDPLGRARDANPSTRHGRDGNVPQTGEQP
jgi:hypothetical protein